MSTITATAAGYTATLDTTTIRVSICDADGHWVGDGTWGKQIDDCPADLGDEAYEALDEALRGALAPSLGEVEPAGLSFSAAATIAAAYDVGFEYPDSGAYVSTESMARATAESLAEELRRAGASEVSTAPDGDEQGQWWVYVTLTE